MQQEEHSDIVVIGGGAGRDDYSHLVEKIQPASPHHDS